MNSNPILNFRLSIDQQQRSKISYIYSIKLGVHLTLNGYQKTDSRWFGQTTMITETREAVDSSEHS
ncbi:hypothetical protein [Sphingobacterium daejeonense]|uniref:hypothetical protein n=1 Tax=Sphingobacterium daejeonense TaxID=371142 RepID=UPI003D321996